MYWKSLLIHDQDIKIWILLVSRNGIVMGKILIVDNLKTTPLLDLILSKEGHDLVTAFRSGAKHYAAKSIHQQKLKIRTKALIGNQGMEEVHRPHRFTICASLSTVFIRSKRAHADFPAQILTKG